MPRFERIAVVLSGGGALGAYQAGALAAMEQELQSPGWFAGIGTGACNAAIMAGTPPGQRGVRLWRFWQRLGELARDGAVPLRRRLWRRRAPLAAAFRDEPAWNRRVAIDPVRLRRLLEESIDFPLLNSGTVRVTLATTHLATGGRVLFDNDRHRVGLDHVMASLALPGGLPPTLIDGEPYGNGAVLGVNALASLFDAAPPADTLCFVIDDADPAPPGAPGLSRSGQEIAAWRRRYELRRSIARLGEHLPAAARREAALRDALAQGASATIDIVHLVHEVEATRIADRLADFGAAALGRRWQAGSHDMAASLVRAAWMQQPTRQAGVTVHEMRGGAPRSRS